MRVETDEYNRTMIIHDAGGMEPLNIPLVEVTNTKALIATIDEYVELPKIFPSRLLLPGIIDSEHEGTTLKNICGVITQMAALMKEVSDTDGFILSVIYNNGSLDFVFGKLNFMIGPDTLISEQVGTA